MRFHVDGRLIIKILAKQDLILPACDVLFLAGHFSELLALWHAGLSDDYNEDAVWCWASRLAVCRREFCESPGLLRDREHRSICYDAISRVLFGCKFKQSWGLVLLRHWSTDTFVAIVEDTGEILGEYGLGARRRRRGRQEQRQSPAVQDEPF